MRLRVGGAEVASYVAEPSLDIRLGPRPYLHPVRTLGGTEVTETVPRDHPWHLGVSVAMQDVNGANLWGGRTYVRGQGYVWREDHGRIVHTGWLPVADGGPVDIGEAAGGGTAGVEAAGGGAAGVEAVGDGARSSFAEALQWQDPSGAPLLDERRVVAAAPAPHGWELSFAYDLTAAGDVTLGSPATNGRPDGAGYGGFFWRAAPGAASAFTAGRDGEKVVNGSDEPWVAMTVGESYTLVLRGLRGDDRWFVRTGEYPGVCAALAYERPLVIPSGHTVSRRLTVLVADGALSRDEVAAYTQA